MSMSQNMKKRDTTSNPVILSGLCDLRLDIFKWLALPGNPQQPILVFSHPSCLTFAPNILPSNFQIFIELEFFSMKVYKTLKMDNSSPSLQSSTFISIKLLSFNPRLYPDTENSSFPSLLQLPFYIFKRVVASLKPQPSLD